MSKRLRIIFFGLDGLYSTIPFRAILEDHDICAVYSDSRPGADKNTGLATGTLRQLARTGRSILFGMDASRPATLEETACRFDIPYCRVRTVNTPEIAGEIRSLEPDLICIASFNRIIKPLILRLPRLGMLNVHAALLPEFRGPNPFFWMVKNQARFGGCTLHWAAEKVDAGAIIARRELPLVYGLRPQEYYDALAIPAAELYRETLAACADGKPPAGILQTGPDIPICRNPLPEDLQVDRNYSVKQALWFHRVACEYGRPFVVDNGERVFCRHLSQKPRPHARQIGFTDGELWAD